MLHRLVSRHRTSRLYSGELQCCTSVCFNIFTELLGNEGGESNERQVALLVAVEIPIEPSGQRLNVLGFCPPCFVPRLVSGGYVPMISDSLMNLLSHRIEIDHNARSGSGPKGTRMRKGKVEFGRGRSRGRCVMHLSTPTPPALLVLR